MPIPFNPGATEQALPVPLLLLRQGRVAAATPAIARARKLPLLSVPPPLPKGLAAAVPIRGGVRIDGPRGGVNWASEGA